MDTDELFNQLYDDLRRIASVRMRGERPGHTLQTTALLNETYLRLAHRGPAPWADRTHFLATASLAMRRILIDHARKHRRRVRLVSGFETDPSVIPDGTEYLRIDRAIDALSAEYPRQALVLQFRYVLGMSLEDVAKTLQVSSRTITDDARLGLAWVRRRLAECADRLPD